MSPGAIILLTPELSMDSESPHEGLIKSVQIIGAHHIIETIKMMNAMVLKFNHICAKQCCKF